MSAPLRSPLGVTPLEERLTPVLGALAAPPALTPIMPAYGAYSGVVQLSMAGGESGAPDGTESLIVEPDFGFGRHILTAAHVVRDTTSGYINFDLTGTV